LVLRSNLNGPPGRTEEFRIAAVARRSHCITIYAQEFI